MINHTYNTASQGWALWLYWTSNKNCEPSRELSAASTHSRQRACDSAQKEYAGDEQTLLLASDSEEVALANRLAAKARLNILPIVGIPLNRSVVRYNRFLINSAAEIIQAIADYCNGRMGTLSSNILLQRIRQHQYLRELRNKLLNLHQVLLQTERITYEQVRGRVLNTELLQLAIEHE